MQYNPTLFSHGFKVYPDKNSEDQLQYTYFVRAPHFRVLVFKGGGGRVWVYKKFINMLEENGLMNNVKEYGGSSAGGLFAVLAAMPLKQKEREKIISDMQFHRDILDHSTGSKIYKIITFPLYFISSPLNLISKGFSFAGNFFLNIKYGFILGYPLLGISHVIKFAAAITHPECAAGLYNIVTKGGIYRGNELQDYVKKSLHQGTQLSLERFLNQLNPQAQERMINKLIRMHDLILNIKKDPKTHKVRVILNTEDITFKHFHELSKIKGLGFKDVFLTGTHCQKSMRGQIKIYSHKKTPDKPIHLAIRISMSAPLLYQAVYDEGKYFMDGGCADNFPIRYASRRFYANDFEKKYFSGIYGQDLDVLGVRIEYKQDLGIFDRPITMIANKWDRFKAHTEKWLLNFICGMDIYTPESQTRHRIKKKFPLRVLQLYDHEVGLTEVNIEENRRKKILQSEEKHIQEFINAHNAELAHVENYDSITKNKIFNNHAMGHKRQKQFLRFLQKKNISDECIFSAAFTDEKAAECRQELIDKLRVNLKGYIRP